MSALLFPLHAAPDLTQRLLDDPVIGQGEIEHRRFPDGESYLRLHTPVRGRKVILLCGLDRPDDRLVTLLLAADAARAQGGTEIGLVAPYLAYMRQDCAFQSGEAVSAQSFAAILSRHFDWLVTLEPHLHRIASLDEVFDIPAIAAQASGPIGDWIASHVAHPFLIGPDRESAPWIRRIARHAECNFAVLDKVRRGDRDVQITGSLEGLHSDMTPVIVDDIVSSGATMAAILDRVASKSSAKALYITVHALTSQTYGAGKIGNHAARFISCNAVPHPSNQIDIAAPLLRGVHQLLGRPETGSSL
ncbi:ribose-phosphate diphosphokinase [Erythrobacter insulae]|uniref:Ribose-phosphate diphosphokinase n=1 Tax=Erythrobacter insulae TaxID=2584124 RepID=A0A547PBW3_9SPHN|nr:ribose-phosphate diphosphokinase [Erythrobacter insulae]TRD11619.1 ribose-phosphate diphosphokinase [Erythrobacter insulae]